MGRIRTPLLNTVFRLPGAAGPASSAEGPPSSCVLRGLMGRLMPERTVARGVLLTRSGSPLADHVTPKLVGYIR